MLKIYLFDDEFPRCKGMSSIVKMYIVCALQQNTLSCLYGNNNATFFTFSLPSYETTLHSWRVKEKRILSSQENLYIYKQFWYAISWTLPCEYRKADHQSAELKKKMHTNLSWARVLGAAGFVRHNRSDTCYKHMWSIYIKILTWTTKKFRTSLSCLVPASARLRSHRRFEMEQAHSNNKQI